MSSACRGVLGRRARDRGYFSPEVVERLVREHVSGVRDWHPQLWNLLVLELWHQTFIDTRPAGPSVTPAPGAAGLLAGAGRSGESP